MCHELGLFILQTTLANIANSAGGKVATMQVRAERSLTYFTLHCEPWPVQIESHTYEMDWQD